MRYLRRWSEHCLPPSGPQAPCVTHHLPEGGDTETRSSIRYPSFRAP
eukprot:CAMPEP_0167816750 /NCGR_PEP_ID=MMETSP0112_2-20121227/3797_1 /TAXON_ID=91324 /ORGANISM="Lotharella globosa, Strain CCCM811" /LENGTH=46 /DNA_ID= /DNA_START= /DNA_END= /DNA_ORIENTATION=